MNRREALRWATVALGGALGAITSPSLANAIAADAKPSPDTAGVFSADQFKQISLLAEIIIPTTSTPGAVSAGVPAFIAMMVADWYTETERNIFIAGLADINHYCETTFARPLQQCDAAQLTQALTDAEKQAMTYQAAQSSMLAVGAVDENSPFFHKLKELTVVGYFTSEVGIRQSLAYNPMPMEYKGDIPLAEHGVQWAQY